MEPGSSVALVTGGAHRVGRALALGLARAGTDVAVHSHTSADAAQDTVAEIEALGRRALAVRADLTDAAAAPSLIDEVRRGLGRLDVLVNSASTFERAPVDAITPEAWDHVFAVNLRAPFLLSRAAAPLLREHDGVIVNIADLSALQPWPTFAHHSVSKAGLVHLTRVLARALAPHIRVNCIVPGTVLPPEGYDGEDYAGGRERRLIERPGAPRDVVEALLYVVRADFVTGAVLVVDGGRMMM